jgi:hypothetical protein
MGRDEMFEPMLTACPTFRAAYEGFLADWAGDPDKPQYLALAELARHLVSNLREGQTQDFPAVFAVVESWLLEGDSYVAEAVVVGLLEALQNTNMHPDGTVPDQFLPFLGNEARYWWEQVDQFWEGGRMIVDRRTRH